MKLSKIWLALLGLMMFMSCTDFVPQPKDLISKSDMAEIMMQLNLQEQIGRIDMQQNPEGRTEAVLKKNGVTAKQYTESISYYTAMDEMSNIYEEALDKLEENHPKEIQKIKDAQQKDALQEK